MKIAPEDLESLRYAKSLLEYPSLAAKIAGVIGKPIEIGITMLPADWSALVGKATQKALHTAMGLAIVTLADDGPTRSSDRFHKMIVAATGAGGGTFGFGGLGVELPLSTTVMLRSVADIARSQGEPIKSAETRIACMQVFALGGRTKSDDATDSGYFAVRTALAQAANDAAQYLASQGATAGAPQMIRFIAGIAERFGIVVSEKVAAQAIPVLGAVGGAVINVLFIDHFQDIARGHFTVRRLERTYGVETVRTAYARL